MLCRKSCSNASCCVKLLIMQTGIVLLWGKCFVSNRLTFFKLNWRCSSGDSNDGLWLGPPHWSRLKYLHSFDMECNVLHISMVSRGWNLLTLVIPTFTLSTSSLSLFVVCEMSKQVLCGLVWDLDFCYLWCQEEVGYQWHSWFSDNP